MLPALTLAGIVSVNAPPDAEDPFRWEAAEGCPAADEVQRNLDADFSEEPSSLRAEAVVSRRRGGYSLDLTLISDLASQTRTFEATDCADLLDIALLSYSAARTAGFNDFDQEIEPLDLPIDPAPEDEVEAPTRLVPSPQVEPSPAPEDESHAPLDTSAPASSEDPLLDALLIETPEGPAAELDEPEPETPPYSFSVRGRAGVGEGPLGPFTAAVGGSLSLSRRWWKVLAAGVFHPVKRIEGSNPDRGVAVTAWNASLGLCASPNADARFALDLCGSLAGGRVRGAGFGVALARVVTLPTLQPRVSAEVTWAATRIIRPFLAAYGGVSLLRGAFDDVELDEELYRIPGAEVAVYGGLELHFRLNRAAQ